MNQLLLLWLAPACAVLIQSDQTDSSSDHIEIYESSSESEEARLGEVSGEEAKQLFVHEFIKRTQASSAEAKKCLESHKWNVRDAIVAFTREKRRTEQDQMVTEFVKLAGESEEEAKVSKEEAKQLLFFHN